MASQAPRRVALGAVVLLAVLLPAAPAYAAETVIGFDHFPGSAEVVPPGTPVTTQWASEGLKLGTAEAIGDSAPGEGNCGAPHVEHETPILKAPSEPNFAVLPRCPLGAGPVYRGTYGALLGHPRGALSVEVASVPPVGSSEVNVTLTAYNSEGVEIEHKVGTALKTAFTKIAVPNSSNAQISFFSVTAQTPNENEIAIDNLSFEAPAVTTTPPPGPAPPGPAPPTSPTAALALATPSPHAGEPIALSGAGSTPGSGRIISYGWNFSGGQTVETSTGTNPIAHITLPPGLHTVTMTVTNSNNERSTTSLSVNLGHLSRSEAIYIPDGGEGECMPELEIGDANLLAKCIQTLGKGYVIEGDLQINGMVLVPKSGFLKVTTNPFLGVELRGASVYIQLENTPLGSMVLGERNLETEPIILESFTYAHQQFEGVYHSFNGSHAWAAAGGGSGGGGGGGGKGKPTAGSHPSKVLLVAFAIGQKCEGKEKGKANCCPSGPQTACAELPGNFPLKGEVDVYLTNKGKALLDVQVGLNLKEYNFEATGALEIIVNKTGIELQSLKFEIGEASLAPIFKVKNASFEYFFPEYYEESKRDSWQAKGTISFGEGEGVECQAELAFKHGNFKSASMKFKESHGGVPIYPGVLLNEIGAGVGVEPLEFEGSLGASIVESFELEAAFRFREEVHEKELGFFGAKGTLSWKEHEIASLAADVYTDGYMDAQLKFHIQYPFEGEPFVKVAGELGFWDEPATAKWEADGSLEGKLWILEAEIAGLINNKDIAGCGRAGFGEWKVGAYGFYNFQNGEGGGQLFPNNCKETLEPYREHPAVKHSGGFVGGESADFLPSANPSWAANPLRAAAYRAEGSAPATAAAGGESETVTLPGNPHGEELRISASSGSPIVTLVGPSGQMFTTPSAPGQLAHVGAEFVAALAPNPRQVIILLRKGQHGEWKIERDPGSGPIGKVEGAGVLPAPTISAHVRRHGGSWTVQYRIGDFARGMKVELLERGRDGNHLIATVSKASGSVRFVPQEALGRSREIIATVLGEGDAPHETLAVGRFTAPRPFRPGKPHNVGLVRHRDSALLTWSAVSGARSYRIEVRGSDGRLETHFRKPNQRTVAIPNVLGFESFTANVVAVGGKDMLKGQPATATLKPARATQRPVRRRKKH